MFTVNSYSILNYIDISLGINYFVRERAAKYCDQRVCVCLMSIYPLVYLKNNTSKSRLLKFSVYVTCDRGFDGNTIRYVLPVFWMMLCFHIIN